MLNSADNNSFSDLVSLAHLGQSLLDCLTWSQTPKDRFSPNVVLVFEPCHKNTCLQGLQQGNTIGVNFILWILSMCNLRQITHKLSKAKFVSDLRKFTHQ